MYPKKIEVNGRIYNINTDYKVALACLKVINDDSITDFERYLAIETLLLGEDVLLVDSLQIRDKIKYYLQCGNEEEITEEERDFDYFQDEREIRTSIRQCYGIDLNKEKDIHWWEYNELISGLTNESILNKIRDLRTYDISDIKDEKERKRIINAKNRVALKINEVKSDKEKEIDKIWDNILN